ncbi:DUF58 domain-containing protein [Curvivirga aplysinae]|uniref:DUF58 domain-containing protein n=1 Tax=Curvivirga aplysinae TaxID=2529852 RepID=UPI0012BC79C6|nr:DUF58 domain-containing protein [Curvivirga aplysinae]MTI10259.1 DUF58 domain-containing protein [Curvivirga aplysinae]
MIGSKTQKKKNKLSLLGLSLRKQKKLHVFDDQTDYLTYLQADAQDMAKSLPALLLAAERVASTVAQGVHGQRRAGIGESFWQYRPFNVEDSRQKIDWRRSARSDALYVRETEWEAAQSLWIWRDSSPSMSYSSSQKKIKKGIRADILALAISHLALQAGERVGLLEHMQSAGQGRMMLQKLAHALIENREISPNEDNLLNALQKLPPNAHILLISDFLDNPEIIEKRIKILADRKIKTSFLCIFDPAEKSLPFKGRIRFNGLKNELPVLIRRTQSIRPDYKEKRNAHFSYLQNLAHHHNWQWLSHNTKNSAESCLMALYQMMDRPQHMTKIRETIS